jgi:photosystem II stability/assembly factor-like uncharacterized protein
MNKVPLLALVVCLLAACADSSGGSGPSPDSKLPVASTSAGLSIPPGTHQVVISHPWWSYDDQHDLDARPDWTTAGDLYFPGGGDPPYGYGESYVRAQVSYGPDPAHKRPTVYFRNEAFVLDRPNLRALYLRVMYDDAFVFYINGHEAGRVGMPAGRPTYDTLAASGHEAENRYETFDISAQIPLLFQGYENPIAFEVHQASASSSDLVFDAQLVAYYDTPVDVTTTEAIPERSEWHVLDAASAPAGWNAPGFDDSRWAAGHAPLGFGEDYLQTPTAPGRVTTYFRKDFTVEGSLHGLTGHVMYDDGFVVYLNGHELGRAAMPSGAVTPTTLAAGHEAANHYVDFDWSWALPLLVRGRNTLAVEVHQASLSSSDLVFDLGLDIIGGWETRPSGIEPFQGSGYWSGFGVWFTDALHGLVSVNGEVAHSADGARSWSSDGAAITGQNMSVRFVDAQHGWMYGIGGRIQATGDGGATWIDQASGVTDDILDLSFVSPLVGFALAEHVGPEPEKTILLRTSDGGATWTHTAFALPDNTSLRALAFADAQHGWLVGQAWPDVPRAVVYATSDGGLTLHEQTRAPTDDVIGLHDVAVLDASTVVAVGERSTYGADNGRDHELTLVTRDGGSTWSEAPRSRNDRCLRLVEFIDARHGWAAGCLGGIIHTDDGGATWQVQRAVSATIWPPPGMVLSLHMVDGAVGYAGDEYGNVLVTSTGGK